MRNKPKYKEGDIIIWSRSYGSGCITARITKVCHEQYQYAFLTPESVYGKSSTGVYDFLGLEKDTRLRTNPNKIWKELNE